MKHFIESQQLDKELISELFSLADIYRNHQTSVLRGKIVATLFYEPSTRTRLSFESATYRLGGNVITTENAKTFSSAVKGESLEDTIRIVGNYADMVVLRHHETDSSKRASTVSPVPLINAGDGAGQHPSQALIDLYTIKKEIGHLHGVHVAMAGDLKYGRTVRSLSYLLSKYENVRITFVSTPELRIGEDIKTYLEKKNTTYNETSQLGPSLRNADVIYMTRVQEERIIDPIKKQPFIIDENNINLIKHNSRILHPLPHLEEISFPIELETTDKRIAYFRQAQNGLYVRCAILDYLSK